MKTTNYILKGKDVLSGFAGLSVTFRRAETIDDARTFYGNVDGSVIQGLQADFDIYLQGRLRAMAGAKNDDGSAKHTAADIQKFADTAVKGVRTPGSPKAIKPETVAARASKDVGSELLGKCRDETGFLAKAIKFGAITQAKYDIWLAANPVNAVDTNA